jgi:hypothetical protein
MSSLIRWALYIVVTCYAFAASVTYAQNFEVNLGAKKLGTLTYAGTAKGKELRATLDNTPLGVFNGTFKASSRPTQTSSGTLVQKFESVSKSSRKTRNIAISIDDGRVVGTAVDPASERTKLSDIDAVPRGVVDPVTAIGKLVSAQGCPKEFTIYDGRRAIRLRPTGAKQDGDLLTCAIQYEVVAGPGHLSPLYISSVKMRVQYDLSDNQQHLIRIRMGSGLFNLVLNRTG